MFGTKEKLESLYLTERLSSREIGKRFGVDPKSVCYALRRFDIPVRGSREGQMIVWERRAAEVGLTRDALRKMYIVDGMSSTEIGKLLGVNGITVRRWLIRFGMDVRKSRETLSLMFQRGVRDQTGERNPVWKGGRFKTARGYVKVKCPEHARADDGGYVWEHVLIWEREHGPLPVDWVVHHLNGVRDDNRPENLFGMHSKRHHWALFVQELQARIRQLESLSYQK